MSSGKTLKGAALDVKIEEVSPSRRAIEVLVPSDEVSAEYEKACRKYARNIKVPGFRAGKVPPHIIKQRFGREVEQETVERAIQDALRRAVEQEGLAPIRPPKLKEYSYEPGKPLAFTAEYDIIPAVAPRGLDGIKVEPASPAVTDKMISSALESLRERSARFEPVEGRGVAPGDHVQMNVAGSTEGG